MSTHNTSAVEEHLTAGDLVVTLRRDEGVHHWRLIVDTNTPRLASGDRAMNTVAAELVLEAAQEVIARNKRPLRHTAADQALAAEVRTIIADRDWTGREAAEAFGMAPTKLSARLCGYAAWHLQDLLDIGVAIGMTTSDALEHFTAVMSASTPQRRLAA